jgi:hypothetical protein
MCGKTLSCHPREGPAEKMEASQVSKHGPSISHILFVDDCLLFTQAKTYQIKQFCLAYELKVIFMSPGFFLILIQIM